MALLQFKFDLSAPDFPGAEILDCSSIEGSRRYCDPSAQKLLKEKIAGRWQGIHLLGSGDYHYLTKLITDSIPESFDLLLFDHHPDMQAPLFEGMLSCGGWLRDMLLSNGNLRQVSIIGIDPALKSETSGFGERVQVFCEGERIIAPEASGQGLPPLYISIDKDVFCPCFARTSWDQGSLTMPLLEQILPLFTKGRKVLGADICGSFSMADGGSAQDCSLNFQTDSYLLKLLNI